MLGIVIIDVHTPEVKAIPIARATNASSNSILSSSVCVAELVCYPLQEMKPKTGRVGLGFRV